ncbi:MAG TPA: Dabb family protein, partial [Polyangiales bacterium]|nr:Dabb family protein [Polyangiales bacterium]
IPGLLDCHWGENFAPKERAEGLTHGFSMDFADRASLEGYGPHPAHQPAAKLVRGAFERIVVLDFELTAR